MPVPTIRPLPQAVSRAGPPYLWAGASALAAFVLYALTLAPTTSFWDASEYIATAHILGLPHPPGNPLFVVLGKVWTLLLAPTGFSIAVRMNLLAALTSAAATGFFFLVMFRILERWAAADRPEGEEGGAAAPPAARWLPLVGAWAGSILATTAFTVWSQSTVNEKVYTPSVLIIAIVSWLTVRWLDRREEPGSARLIVLAVYLMVLGSTIHLMSLLPGPALLATVLAVRRHLLGDRRFLARASLAAVVGLSFNFVLPLRAADQPVINEGEPTCDSAGGAVVAVYSLGRAGCPALAANLSREQYGKPSIFDDPTSDPLAPEPRGIGILTHQFLNYFQYFDWQWGRGLSASETPGNTRLAFSLVFLGLGIWGVLLARRAGRGALVYLAVLTLTVTPALVVYLNFRYGYSLDPGLPPGIPREVRERDYFFIASFHLWGFLAGAGLVAAWRWAAGPRLPRLGLALGSPVLLLALVPLVFNWNWAGRNGDYAARDWAYNLLQSVEPYGIVFTNGDNDTFPLWYLQEVEGVRQDVTVIVVQYLMTQWYPRQLRYHTDPARQRPFNDPVARSVYGEPAGRPTRPITTLTDEELNSVGFAVLPREYTVTVGAQPVRYPEGFQFTRADQLALAIVQDAIAERPVHFASTGTIARSLGLDPYVVRQGIAGKLRLEGLEDAPGVVRVSENIGGEWIDLDRSIRLAEEVFSYRGLIDRPIWEDRSTLNIPWHFYFLYLQMADAVARAREGEELSAAEEERMERFLDRADRFLLTAEGGTAIARPPAGS